MAVSMAGTIPSPLPTVDFSGTWYNQRGSEMNLIVNGSIVTGTYKTKVGSPDDKDLFFLTGFATGDLISFTVNFGKFDTLTSWAGQFAKEEGEPEMIHTCFVASVDVKEREEHDQIWGGVKAGSDFFQRDRWTWPGSSLKGAKRGIA
jgi:Avidin family